jgi:two-component system, NtrC family, sensor histidine kinase GlrK
MLVRLHYPSSFLKFTLLGFVVAAIPILAGLFYSVVSLDRLVGYSQRAVYQSAQAVNGSRDLLEQVVAMERGARQFAILGDDALRLAYLNARDRFIETSGSLDSLNWQMPQRQLLRDLIDQEAALHARLAREKLTEKAMQRHTRAFVTLVDLARQIADQGHHLVDQEIAALQAQVETARSRVNWMLLGLVPLAILLAIGVPLLIVKPVRQLDAAIQRLRAGDFSRSIGVRGPSDLEYLAERLDWMRQGMLDAESDKSRFLRHLSHELKTPLTAVREGVELLWDGSLGELPDAQREVIAILRANSLRLQKLIEDLLAYRALISAAPPVELRQITAGSVLDRVLSDQRVALLAKRVRVEVEGGAIELCSDPERLRVIMDNLVSNAIKFSPSGGFVRLKVSTDQMATRFEVSDQGPGIAPADRSRVFDAFYQGEPPAAASVQGTGLGLSIAREHVLALGGSIDIDENYQGGACFRVMLPSENQVRT